jgi:hypothetical protein
MVGYIYRNRGRHTMPELMTSPIANDLDMLKLAREIAMDIQPLQDILKQYSIDEKTWGRLQQNPRFAKLLAAEAEAWHTALNTHERVKMKSAAMLEEWLPELFTRLHDREEGMNGKVEAGKMLARIAGLTDTGSIAAAVGERFSITINMGTKSSEFLKEVKDVTPPTIEGDAWGVDKK